MIKHSDCIMVWFEYATVGTIMEMYLAYTLDIPVYIIDIKQQHCNDIWLGYHATKFFNSIDSCFEYISKEHCYES